MLRQTVSRSVLVSSTLLGLKTKFFSCLTIAGLLMWGALSDERTDLCFTMYNVQYIYILHVITRMDINNIYIYSFCQSRLSTADYALASVASVYEF
jgi:hypothetical protein